ncbi:hypothetical protein Adt_31574 [Abeliophyllum distichum]|uniref:Uncharacterized protein n=1 Tax=Abeliophyllum distichum TaxID=126358 RepID=A0ABD1Q372_9LAMI
MPTTNLTLKAHKQFHTHKLTERWIQQMIWWPPPPPSPQFLLLILTLRCKCGGSAKAVSVKCGGSAKAMDKDDLSLHTTHEKEPEYHDASDKTTCMSRAGSSVLVFLSEFSCWAWVVDTIGVLGLICLCNCVYYYYF